MIKQPFKIISTTFQNNQATFQKHEQNLSNLLLLIFLKCCVYDFETLFNDFDVGFNDLSRCSKNFERAPFVGFSATHN